MEGLTHPRSAWQAEKCEMPTVTSPQCGIFGDRRFRGQQVHDYWDWHGS